MNMNDIITKKRDGNALTEEEIRYFVSHYTDGAIPDYQAAALLMAIYFQKLSREEIYVLTDAMRYSGDTADLSEIKGTKVDKHSTGGVGDKTTMIVAPLSAACGVPIAKMSGRGLGFTGGTVDKLEAIPGFQTSVETDKFMEQVNKAGIAVIGQTAHITPADKKIYALRDVTGTVENLGLIASSIMSKKLAAGSDAIVLDVKCGDGAFMKTLEDATALAEIMCDIGENAGRRTMALITDMNQPLGRAVGNSLEVIEAIEVLKGRGPSDIRELSLKLAGHMIYAGGICDTAEEGCQMAEKALEDGRGLEKLRQLITWQGGDAGVIDDYSLFPQSAHSEEIHAEKEGYISAIEAEDIGIASQYTGAGRATKEDTIDLSAGIYLNYKIGDRVKKGDCLAVIYSNSEEKLADAASKAKEAFEISREEPEVPELIKKHINC